MGNTELSPQSNSNKFPSDQCAGEAIRGNIQGEELSGLESLNSKILPRPNVCWEKSELNTVSWQTGYEESEDIKAYLSHSDIH